MWQFSKNLLTLCKVLGREVIQRIKEGNSVTQSWVSKQAGFWEGEELPVDFIMFRHMTAWIIADYGRFWDIKMPDWFDVKTGVHQVCIMWGFFLWWQPHWVMTNTLGSRCRGLTCMGIYKCRSMLEDLDYKIILLDDVALLASRYTCILEKSIRLQALQVSLD